MSEIDLSPARLREIAHRAMYRGEVDNAVATLRALADRDEAASKTMIEKIDRLENAARAHERLGTAKRDDEKTRNIRKAAIQELASARRAFFAATGESHEHHD